MQIHEIKLQDSDYPALLREIPTPPKQLYVLGKIPVVPMIAIVGTRTPTAYGRQMTYKFAKELASAGIPIVSGLANGLDTEAHRGALDGGGITIAVQARGLDAIYPSRNKDLAKEILIKGGAIISEYDVGTIPFPGNFVARNRIISGLCVGTLVTEAAAESGTLLTANFAVDQNRTVMAVPGNITSAKSAGPNNLIKTGGIAVTSSSDILAALNMESATMPKVTPKALSAAEAKILTAISEGHTKGQELIDITGIDAAAFAQTISLMEITGKVRNLGAGTWIART